MGALRIILITCLIIFGTFVAYSEYISTPRDLKFLDELERNADFVFSGLKLLEDETLVEKDTGVQFDRVILGYKRRVEYCQWTEQVRSFSKATTLDPKCRGSNYCRSVRNIVECEANPSCYWDLGGQFRAGASHVQYGIHWMSEPVSSLSFRRGSSFVNPQIAPIEEVEAFVNVGLSERNLKTSAKNLKSILKSESYKFSEADFESLKRSPSYQNGFTFMNEDYVILDFSQLTNSPSFKNFPGSVCTPGDVRMSVQVYRIVEAAAQSSYGMVGKIEGSTLAPYKNRFLIQKGKGLKVRDVLNAEASNIFWWQNFYRILFVAVNGSLLLIMLLSGTKSKPKAH